VIVGVFGLVLGSVLPVLVIGILITGKRGERIDGLMDVLVDMPLGLLLLLLMLFLFGSAFGGTSLACGPFAASTHCVGGVPWP
jgi:hypothetical protein